MYPFFIPIIMTKRERKEGEPPREPVSWPLAFGYAIVGLAWIVMFVGAMLLLFHSFVGPSFDWVKMGIGVGLLIICMAGLIRLASGED